MAADIRPVYFTHAEGDTERAKIVDDWFNVFIGPDPKDKGKADPRVTSSLWKVLHGYTHPGARQLARLFTGTEIKPNYSQLDIAQALHLTTTALIFLMWPFFISMGKQAEADEVHALALQYFAEFNGRLSRPSVGE